MISGNPCKHPSGSIRAFVTYRYGVAVEAGRFCASCRERLVTRSLDGEHLGLAPPRPTLLCDLQGSAEYFVRLLRSPLLGGSIDIYPERAGEPAQAGVCAVAFEAAARGLVRIENRGDRWVCELATEKGEP